MGDANTSSTSHGLSSVACPLHPTIPLRFMNILYPTSRLRLRLLLLFLLLEVVLQKCYRIAAEEVFQLIGCLVSHITTPRRVVGKSGHSTRTFKPGAMWTLDMYSFSSFHFFDSISACRRHLNIGIFCLGELSIYLYLLFISECEMKEGNALLLPIFALRSENLYLIFAVQILITVLYRKIIMTSTSSQSPSLTMSPFHFWHCSYFVVTGRRKLMQRYHKFTNRNYANTPI